MAVDHDQIDLVDVADAAGTGCVVRVAGRFQPGVLTGHDILRTDVLVSASFVDARLQLFLSPGDLDEWRRDLAQLAAGGSATLGADRGLSLGFRVYEDGWLAITVEDPDRLTAQLGLRPAEAWIAEHLRRLERVRAAWPREVCETAPGAYVWSSTAER
ncbi:hypothetical protein KDK95_17680 [Actinospica sp. MGRD01-02]|uniref:Uncharacterized protein n=1 Tax=Actinospica acidithermotolerans TaxID=2828514 RepID=A0A941EBD8_9ACTN|nr:DUF5959 family protein [Actinospica acidithermotolerans]MBR7828152.1 hypothetical protein [Actinospica acidithermotolerans]